MDWRWLVERPRRAARPGVDAENLAEMDGMVEGLQAAGVPTSRAS